MRATTGLALAVLLFALITVWRFSAVSEPLAGVAFLYTVPIAVIAASAGAAAGIVAAVLALALVLAWDSVRGIGLAADGYLVRTVSFLSVALLVGWQSRARRAVEHEADRWFEMSNDLVCIADVRGEFTRVNSSWTVLLGYETREMLGRPYLDFVHPDDIEPTLRQTAALATSDHRLVGFENRYRANDGSWHWLLWSARSDGRQVFAVAKDISERKALEEKLNSLVREDTLTGAANRRACDERLALELRRTTRSGKPLAIALLDLDHLKQINDASGHAAGDRFLLESVTAWRGAIRDVDFLARIGGDEFCVIFPETDAEGAGRVVSRMLKVMPGESTFSAGVGTWNTTESVSELMQRVDRLLYQAKHEGRGRIAG